MRQFVSMVQIRAATMRDMPALRAIFIAASLSNLGDRAVLLANPDTLELNTASTQEGRTRVATAEDGRVVAFATTAPVGDLVEIEDLFVQPDWMGRGVGRALVADIVAEARRRGAQRVEVIATDPAVAFYRKLGFVFDRVVATRFRPALRLYLNLATGGREGEMRVNGPLT
jgi:GNAT superfamily N-acetyltransferase